jgi:hypothetical protein
MMFGDAAKFLNAGVDLGVGRDINSPILGEF